MSFSKDWPPLYRALWAGKTEMVRALLFKEGTNPNAVCKNGATALTFIAGQDLAALPDMITMLLAAGGTCKCTR